MTSITANFNAFNHINNLFRRGHAGSSALTQYFPRMRHTGQSAPKIVNLTTPLQGGQPIDYDQAVANLGYTIERENVATERERLKGETPEKSTESLEFKLSQPIKATLIKEVNALIKETQYVFSGDISIVKFVDIFQKFNDLSYSYNEYIIDIKRDTTFALLWHTKLVNLQTIYASLKKRLADIMNGQYSMEELRIKTHGNYNLSYIATLINQIIAVIEMMLVNKNTTTYLQDNMEKPMNDIISGQVSSNPQPEVPKTQDEMDQEEADRLQKEQEDADALAEETRLKKEGEVKSAKDADRKAMEAELRRRQGIVDEARYMFDLDKTEFGDTSPNRPELEAKIKSAKIAEDYMYKRLKAIEVKENAEKMTPEELGTEYMRLSRLERDIRTEIIRINAELTAQIEINPQTELTQQAIRALNALKEQKKSEGNDLKIDMEAIKRYISHAPPRPPPQPKPVVPPPEPPRETDAEIEAKTAEFDARFVRKAQEVKTDPSEDNYYKFVRLYIGPYFYVGGPAKITGAQYALLEANQSRLFKTDKIAKFPNGPTDFYAKYIKTKGNPITPALIKGIWTTYGPEGKNLIKVPNFVKLATDALLKPALATAIALP